MSPISSLHSDTRAAANDLSDDHIRDAVPVSPEMRTGPENNTSPPAAYTSPFAFGGAGYDSDASSAPSSDGERHSTEDGRPITRRDPRTTFDERPVHAVHAVHTHSDPEERLGSPISIDLPVQGGHSQQLHREVRLQLPGQTHSVRPDTVDEEKDLPLREFYSQSSSGEFPDDDEGESVFAFQRPPTAPEVAAQASHHSTLAEEPIGEYGFESRRAYDPSHPPPYSGRSNLNNGVFAASSYAMRNRHSSKGQTPTTNVNKGFPPVTATTMASELSSVDATPYVLNDQGGRFVRGANRPSTGRPSTGRPSTMASSYATESEWTDSEGGGYRPRTRDSGAVTEMTGDATIPDGVTTWGDGLGGEHKESVDGSTEIDWQDEDSPYAEVRASVSNMDDPDMPALTLRAWFLGMFLTLVAGAANTFFYFRTPAPTIPNLVVQVVAYPLGRFLAWALPIRDFTLPRWLGGFTFSLNPCPFNVKEHTLIVMMASIAITPPAAISTVVVSELWYHQPLGLGFSFLFVLASQLTGLTLAGIARRFVVWPASMIWPGVLVMTTNLNTLHAESDPGSGGRSRLAFFLIAGTAAFAWYFVPGFLFTALSYFSYVCWGAPKNKVVNQLFGVYTGLGMGIFTFDWAQIAWLGSPLANPWWAQVNLGIGFLVFYWMVVPAIYYTNTWYTKHLPVMSAAAADRFGNVYNVTRLLTPEYRLNTTAYAEYSPVYLTASFNMTYMLAYALTTSLLVYTALVHGKRLVRTVRRMQVEPDDIHLKLMRKYPEVADWWYLGSLCVCIVLGIVTVEVFGTGLPVWGYLVSIGLAFIYIVPTAIIFALANVEPAVNLIAELIPGYIFQGNPLAGMIFKIFAKQTLGEAMFFIRDMKLGHYMKVPPRAMFICQFSACAITCLVQVGVTQWMFTTIPDMCTAHQKDYLTCSVQKTLYSSSIVWGLVGPERLFSKGGLYNPQLYMLLIGAVLPIPFWLWCRKYPRSIVRNINVCVIFCVCIFSPPATGFNLSSFLFVGFIFQFCIRRYRFAWWSKYNYVLSAALDVGTMISALFIFFALRLPGAKVNWWGNTVHTKTLDWMGTAVGLSTPKTGFGPDTWKV